MVELWSIHPNKGNMKYQCKAESLFPMKEVCNKFEMSKLVRGVRRLLGLAGRGHVRRRGGVAARGAGPGRAVAAGGPHGAGARLGRGARVPPRPLVAARRQPQDLDPDLIDFFITVLVKLLTVILCT